MIITKNNDSQHYIYSELLYINRVKCTAINLYNSNVSWIHNYDDREQNIKTKEVWHGNLPFNN